MAAEPEDGGEAGPAEPPAEADSAPPEKEEEEAEPAAAGGLSLNYEEARALSGRLEYQKGNVEAALCVFDGIDLQAAIQRIQPSLSDKPASKKGRTKSELPTTDPPNAATLVLEAIYLKSLSLQKLGKSIEAAQQCKSVLHSVEGMFQNGPPDIEQKLQETVSKSVELLPEAWKQAGSHQEALAS